MRCGTRRAAPQDSQHAQPGHDLGAQPAAGATHTFRGALTNGVTRDEIREVFMQVAIYAGVPAAVDSFRIARQTFAELDQT